MVLLVVLLGGAFLWSWSLKVKVKSQTEQIRQQLFEKVLYEEKLGELAAIVESSNDAIIGKTLDGVILSWNKGADRIYGYSSEEVVGKSIGMLFTESNKGELDGILEKIGSGGWIRNFETQRRRKDGGVIDVSLTISPIYDPNGRITGASTIARDITVRKRAEKEVLEQRDRAQNYLDIAAVIIVVIDKDFKVTLINRKGCEILGYDEEEILGVDWCENFLPERERDRARRIVDGFFQGEVEVAEYNENSVVNRDGDERLIAWRNTALHDESGAIVGVLSSGEDITDRQRVEEEILKLNEELAKKNEELESILYAASHDLRAPLVNIHGFSEELRNCFEQVKGELGRVELPADTSLRLNKIFREDIPEAVGFIVNSTAKMETLLSGLLKVCRLGQSDIQVEELDMNFLVKSVLQTFDYQMKRSGVDIRLSELPGCVGDMVQLSQVFLNLIDNAIKYLAKDREGIIYIYGRVEPDCVVYCVEDNGVGIAKAYFEKIFEIFHRLSPDVCHGDGLGLTIVRRIVERHGGDVWVESEVGKGSKFYFSLPGGMG